MTFVSSSARGGSLVAPAYVGETWGAVAQGFGSASYFSVGVWVPTAMTFSSYGFRPVTVSGNMWLAVYNSALQRLNTITSFAMPVNGPKTIPGGLFLAAGNYWIVYQADNGTASMAASGANLGGPTSCWSTANTYANGAPSTLAFTAPEATAPLLQLIV